MNLKEYIKHIKSICKQGILRHKNVILDEAFQKELLEIIKCYEQLQQENQELKKQLKENKNPLKGIFSQVNDDMLLRNCGAMQSEIDTYKNQQKEFIEYLEKTIEELECDNVDDEEMKGYLIQRIYTFKEILSKYYEIIGGKDE